jgi:hypothetical protein
MKREWFILIAVAFCLGRAAAGPVPAGPMISNLNHLWPGQSMGNFETVLPGYGYGFMFGTGANPYSLDSVVFQELGGLGTVHVSLYAVQGDPLAGPNPNLIFAGTLGNPVIDPRPTQWPGYTSFIDYSPVNSITLAPDTYYLIAATEPVNGDDNTALTFNFNDTYDVAGDWTADQAVPSAWTYYGSQPPSSPFHGWMYDYTPGSIKVEVNASPVPEPCSFAVLMLGCALLSARRLHRSGPKK